MANTKDILALFEFPKNDFERMSLWLDSYMKEAAVKMKEGLEKFIESGDFKDYLDVKYNFDEVTKYMNGRDTLVTHNPDRSSRY